MDELAPAGPGERGTSVPRGRVLGRRVGGAPPEAAETNAPSAPRFSLRSLLIGFAVLSIVTAGAAMLGKAAYVANEAEKNLIAYSAVSEASASFVDQHGRWPKNEEELRTFAESLPDWSDRGIDVFQRTVVAYDFDLDRDSLAPETFRGLRHRDPVYKGPANNTRDRLLAALRAYRDRNAAPSPVGQAPPDGAEEEPASEEERSTDQPSGDA